MAENIPFGRICPFGRIANPTQRRDGQCNGYIGVGCQSAQRDRLS